jgi:hypothetical protein
LIVSVSTLEHVGEDERPREPAKALRAVSHLVALLAPGGTVVMTLPVGVNEALDRAVRDGRIQFRELYAMRRVSRWNEWEEVYWRSVGEDRYHPGPSGPAPS